MLEQVAVGNSVVELVISNLIWFAEQVCSGIKGDIQGAD